MRVFPAVGSLRRVPLIDPPVRFEAVPKHVCPKCGHEDGTEQESEDDFAERVKRATEWAGIFVHAKLVRDDVRMGWVYRMDKVATDELARATADPTRRQTEEYSSALAAVEREVIRLSFDHLEGVRFEDQDGHEIAADAEQLEGVTGMRSRVAQACLSAQRVTSKQSDS